MTVGGQNRPVYRDGPLAVEGVRSIRATRMPLPSTRALVSSGVGILNDYSSAGVVAGGELGGLIHNQHEPAPGDGVARSQLPCDIWGR